MRSRMQPQSLNRQHATEDGVPVVVPRVGLVHAVTVAVDVFLADGRDYLSDEYARGRLKWWHSF